MGGWRAYNQRCGELRARPRGLREAFLLQRSLGRKAQQDHLWRTRSQEANHRHVYKWSLWTVCQALMHCLTQKGAEHECCSWARRSLKQKHVFLCVTWHMSTVDLNHQWCVRIHWIWLTGIILKIFTKKVPRHYCWALCSYGGELCVVPVCLSAEVFDLCLTAGPGEDVSVGSCRRLISPALTQAQLVDRTLWDSARKLSGPVR